MLRWIVRVGHISTRAKPEDTKEDDKSTISSEIEEDLAKKTLAAHEQGAEA